MKVFCHNCKYRGFSGSRLCTYEDRYTRIGVYSVEKSQRNRQGDCRLYARIWWKFWLEEAGVT